MKGFLRSIAIPLILVGLAIVFLGYGYFSRTQQFTAGGERRPLNGWGDTYRAVWSPPTPVIPVVTVVEGDLRFRDIRRSEILNSVGDDTDPELSADGEFLLFASNRRGGPGGYDLYWSRRQGSSFSTPQLHPISDIFHERSPSLASLGNGEYSLLFTSNRPQGLPLDHDVFMSRGSFGGEWSRPVAIDAISTAADERSAALHPDGRAVLFTTPGRDGIEVRESWLLPDGSWSEPQVLAGFTDGRQEATLNLSEGGTLLTITRDGKSLASRLQLLRPMPEPPFVTGPAWLLLLLALLLLIIKLLAQRWTGLEVLYRCLLISILIHLLLWWWLHDEGIEAPALPGHGPESEEFEPIEFDLDVFSSDDAEPTEAAQGDQVEIAELVAPPAPESEFREQARAALDLARPETGRFEIPDAAQPAQEQRPEKRPMELAEAPSRPSQEQDTEALQLADAGATRSQRSEAETAVDAAAERQWEPNPATDGVAQSRPDVDSSVAPSQWQSSIEVPERALSRATPAATTSRELVAETAAPHRTAQASTELAEASRNALERAESQQSPNAASGGDVVEAAADRTYESSRSRQAVAVNAPSEQRELAAVPSTDVPAPARAASSSVRADLSASTPRSEEARAISAPSSELADASRAAPSRSESDATLAAAESSAAPADYAGSERSASAPMPLPKPSDGAASLAATSTVATEQRPPRQERAAELALEVPATRTPAARDGEVAETKAVAQRNGNTRAERDVSVTQPSESSPTHGGTLVARPSRSLPHATVASVTLASASPRLVNTPALPRRSVRRTDNPMSPRATSPRPPTGSTVADEVALAAVPSSNRSSEERRLSIPRKEEDSNLAATPGLPSTEVRHGLALSAPKSKAAPPSAASSMRPPALGRPSRRTPLAGSPVTVRPASEVGASREKNSEVAALKDAAPRRQGTRERSFAPLQPKSRTRGGSPRPAGGVPTYERGLIAQVLPDARLRGIPSGERAEVQRIRREPETTVVPWLSARIGPRKVEALAAHGGSEETERAVQEGLAYLASTQRRHGGWGNPFTNDEKYGEVAVGKTALALLAFLGAGHHPTSATIYSEVVKNAVAYLISEQMESTGHIGLNTSAYSHGIATYALGEAYLLCGDPAIRRVLEAAVEQIIRNQDLGSRVREFHGGWAYYYHDGHHYDRYPRVSVTVWQLMALKTAQLAKIAFPAAHLEAGRDYVIRSWSPAIGKVLYNRDPQRLRSEYPTLPGSTAAAAFILKVLGHPDNSEEVRGALGMVADNPPRRWAEAGTADFIKRGGGNPYFWYYGTLAMFLYGGDRWDAWNQQLQDALLPSQEENGSWPQISVYARYAQDTDEDRTYTTALNVLMLEVYYRYLTPFQKSAKGANPVEEY